MILSKKSEGLLVLSPSNVFVRAFLLLMSIGEFPKVNKIISTLLLLLLLLLLFFDGVDEIFWYDWSDARAKSLIRFKSSLLNRSDVSIAMTTFSFWLLLVGEPSVVVIELSTP